MEKIDLYVNISFKCLLLFLKVSSEPFKLIIPPVTFNLTPIIFGGWEEGEEQACVVCYPGWRSWCWCSSSTCLSGSGQPGRAAAEAGRRARGRTRRAHIGTPAAWDACRTCSDKRERSGDGEGTAARENGIGYVRGLSAIPVRNGSSEQRPQQHPDHEESLTVGQPVCPRTHWLTHNTNNTLSDNKVLICLLISLFIHTISGKPSSFIFALLSRNFQKIHIVLRKVWESMILVNKWVSKFDLSSTFNQMQSVVKGKDWQKQTPNNIINPVLKLVQRLISFSDPPPSNLHL